MAMRSNVTSFFLGLVGAGVGGALANYGCGWIVGQGFYAPMLPGTLLGLGFGLLSGKRSYVGGLVCLVLGIGLGVFTEWSTRPFAKDASLKYFVNHLDGLSSFTKLMILLGGAVAFWFGMGRERALKPREP